MVSASFGKIAGNEKKGAEVVREFSAREVYLNKPE
jgi:hypothetical protein